MTEEERKAKQQQLRDAVNKYGVKLFEQNKIKELKPFVRVVLERIGYTGALVTDGSMIGDFSIEDLNMSELFKFPVVSQDYIWQVAAHLKETEPEHGTD